jgi:hypothetical protein
MLGSGQVRIAKVSFFMLNKDGLLRLNYVRVD